MTFLSSLLRLIGRCFIPVDLGLTYRRDLHYMRGPGPKWHEKRGIPYVPKPRPRPPSIDRRLADI